VDTYVRPNPRDRVLDIGCGPGDLLNFLPDVFYFGFDQDPFYIESAKKRFGNRGTFYCRAVSRDAFPGDSNFDIIIAMGILHHLNDEEARQLFELAHHLLKPDGRLITYDGCYTKDQSGLTRFILGIDRGKHVRDESGYKKLAGPGFSNISTCIRGDLLNIPYTIIIMECKK
jgi:cyclopropane fatty-acyl-phospholipid synthase-like methyltransferase